MLSHPVRTLIGMGAAAVVRDLTDDVDLTLRLLDRHAAWRERLVETFEFRSTDHVRVRSSYQVRLSRDLLGPWAADPAVGAVRVRLPLTTRPKRPLVGFNVQVAGGRGYLPLRSRIASIQAQYIGELVASSPAQPKVAPLLTQALLEAICSFTPGTVVDFEPQRYDDALTDYLVEGTGLPVSRKDVARWRHELAEPAEILASVLAESPEPKSSSEQFLLAVPLLGPSSVEEVDGLVMQLRTAILAARDAGDEELLEVLGEYGRRWEVLVDAEVPVDQPFLAKIEEDRPLGVGFGGRCTQRLWVGDAPSYHLEVRLFDSAIAFDDEAHVRDATGVLVEQQRWDGRRITNDAISLYTSDPDRPYFLDLTVRLRSAGPVRVLSGIVSLLAVSAIGLLLVVDLEDQRVEKVAVLSIPTTFAVAVLAIREQTSLASRVQRGRQAAMFVGLVLLWAAAIYQLMAK